MRRATTYSVLVVVLLLLAAPIVYDLGVYRFGPRHTLCRRTPQSGSAFWGDAPIGEEVDLTGSSDYTCGPCDETLYRHPRLVLADVESARVVDPCRAVVP